MAGLAGGRIGTGRGGGLLTSGVATGGAAIGVAAAGLAAAPVAGGIAGLAYGGSARSLLQPYLVAAEQRGQGLLACPDLWPLALADLRQLWALAG